MRMRRLKWAKEYIEKSEDVIISPNEYKGNWSSFLNRERIHVEIGSGKGDYWIGMANLYPESGWIGVEKNESACALSLRKVEQTRENVKFIYGDASMIEEWFADGEIDVIHLNFSDPWPKRRTSKRRLSNERFIKKYLDILKEDGEIRMKTDNRKLFEYSIIEFQNNGFELIEIDLDFRSEQHDEDVITEYESKFMELGPIYRAIWKRRT